MESIEVDGDVLAFLRRFGHLSPNKTLRLVLGIDRDFANEEHSDKQFLQPVLDILRGAGGRMKVAELYERIETRGILKAGDYRGAEYVWQNRMRYLADSLRREGVLRRDSDRGVWELA
ncbi:MAG: hypothetical protein NTX75_14430 [Proteobacteria bacterium]|nr:hypothetical protein [Pseudomonadota bacterium]